MNTENNQETELKDYYDKENTYYAVLLNVVLNPIVNELENLVSVTSKFSEKYDHESYEKYMESKYNQIDHSTSELFLVQKIKTNLREKYDNISKEIEDIITVFEYDYDLLSKYDDDKEIRDYIDLARDLLNHYKLYQDIIKKHMANILYCNLLIKNKIKYSHIQRSNSVNKKHYIDMVAQNLKDLEGNHYVDNVINNLEGFKDKFENLKSIIDT